MLQFLLNIFKVNNKDIRMTLVDVALVHLLLNTMKQCFY